MGEGQDRDGATAYADHCQDCHGYGNPDAFTVMVNPALESDAVVDAFFGQDEERWRTSIAFGVVGRTSSDHAFANMRAYYKDLSLAEIDAIIAHIRTLELEPYDYHYGDGSN